MSVRPSVAFDPHAVAHADNAEAVYCELRENQPVAWSDLSGGFWIVTRYADVALISRDDEAFSSIKDPARDGVAFSGVTIPASLNPLLPIELDPPALSKHRQIWATRLSPASARRMRSTYETWANLLIHEFIESGTADLVGQLASPIPALATLAFLGLPLEDWPRYAESYHHIVAYPQDTDEFEQAVQVQASCMESVAREIEDRRRHLRDDGLTQLVQADVDGTTLTDEQALATVRLFLGGGLDTTTALIAHGLSYLDQEPDKGALIASDPGAMSRFCEEMLRFAAPIQTLARTATRDVEIGGQLIRRSERVLLAWAAANRDPKVFSCPDDVMIERSPNPHSSFGFGAHRCVGSHFARIEFTTVLRVVLDWLADYRLTTDRMRYDSIGTVNGWHRLSATFTPGARVGGGLRLQPRHDEPIATHSTNPEQVP